MNYSGKFKDIEGNIFYPHVIKSDGSFTAQNGYLKSVMNGKTVQIGSQNSSCCHYSTDASFHWFNKDVKVQGDIYGGSNYDKRLSYYEEFAPITIYSGSTTTTATLSSSIANYKRIKIFYTTSDNIKGCQEIYNNYSSSIVVSMFSMHTSSAGWIKNARCQINSTSLTLDRQVDIAIRTSATSINTLANAITINRIEGYKY